MYVNRSTASSTDSHSFILYQFMEGHVYTPESAMKCLYLGCHAVVVGSAITRPHFIVKRFTDLMNKFLEDSNWREDEKAWTGVITKVE